MRRIVIAGMALVLVCGAASAGVNLGIAKSAIHVLPHDARTCTSNFPVINGCQDIITTEPGAEIDMFPVFFDLIEYQGLEYSISWYTSNSCAFTSCSDDHVGNIVWPFDGIAHSWDVCQPGPVVVPGWGWLYDGTGLIWVGWHPTEGGPNVIDCSGERDYVCGFAAGVGGYIGDDPCQPCEPVAGDHGTWGMIKGLFK